MHWPGRFVAASARRKSHKGENWARADYWGGLYPGAQHLLLWRAMRSGADIVTVASPTLKS